MASSGQYDVGQTLLMHSRLRTSSRAQTSSKVCFAIRWGRRRRYSEL